MSALWTPGRAGVSPGFLVAQSGACVSGPPPPSSDRRLRWGPEAMTRRRLCLESRLESVYSTRVGIHWPRVVRTARGPHLPAVPPTLVQWHPALVQCVQTTPAATAVTGPVPSDRPKQQLSHPADPPHRCLETS